MNGDAGWLYGEANWIAFQVGNQFHMFERSDLVNYVEGKMGGNLNRNNIQNIRSGPAVAPAWYHRMDRPNEAMTWVNINEIKDKIMWTWG